MRLKFEIVIEGNTQPELIQRAGKGARQEKLFVAHLCMGC